MNIEEMKAYTMKKDAKTVVRFWGTRLKRRRGLGRVDHVVRNCASMALILGNKFYYAIATHASFDSHIQKREESCQLVCSKLNLDRVLGMYSITI